ncbi:Plasma-membrane choline transporter [Seminavis robusta]|uniref:Choline transporter-like protein n=1 Tax=Seminavis robusta TaxID=568900 RepID=A0A9N8DP85_9STRA|nr:Plasma-membrane choline transporter [Seminavis robusta]|eukprot:Sro190_g081740.1 Plasma-membrane choline transporter (763) ;mRNA; r:18820-21183
MSSGNDGFGTPSNPASQRQQQQQQLQGSQSNHSSSSGGLFFADATLDLDEAHDIAETPEPPKRFLKVDTKNTLHPNLRLPQLDSLGGPTITKSSGPTTRNTTASRPTSPSTSQKTSPTQSDAPSSSRSLSGPMTRISNSNGNNLDTRPPAERFRARPRWPRDLPWAIAFCVMVPVGLVWPSLLWHRQNIFGMPDTQTMSPLALPVLRHATFWSVLLAYVSTLLLARGLYRTAGGGEGDDLRYKASQFLLACVPVSVAMNVIMVLAVYFLLPRALHYALIPLWYLIRDVYLFRRWKLQGSGGVAMDSPSTRAPSNPHSSQPNSTRHAFFQALTCMALDILSRSLRRNSLHRCIVTLLTLQVMVTMVWRWAIMGALNTGNFVTVFLALVGGKWATGTIARLLSLIASGGVASWFAENAAMVEEHEMQERARRNNEDKGDEEVGYETSDITEEYRTADASVYQSVLDFDGMDDDDQDDFEYGFSARSNNSEDDENFEYNRRGSPRDAGNHAPKATVKSFFLSGMSVSFGSVAQCGLLGGPAQFVWCQLRKVDATRTALVHRLQQQPRDFQPNRAVSVVMGVAGVNTSGGFRGMQIGQDTNGTSVVHKLLNRANVMARAFVRAHSDLAMSHVAAYYKSYKRAALDVSNLVEQAGMEAIIHDDITTHITSCVGGSISAAIVIFTGYALVRKLEKDKDPVVQDPSVAQSMILSFILCYTIIFTVLEPLRASIKACYVCFAERPRSLRQAFPLIFHRLSRMSESNLNMS